MKKNHFSSKYFILFAFSAAMNLAFAGGLPEPVPCTGCATLPQQIKWNYVLSETPNLSIKADMYDIDGFDNTAAMVASIHGAGAKAVCYIDAGTWENWRSDKNQFPSSVKGANNGWPGEKWLDIRQIAILGPIMQSRIAMCKSKGFDAVEFDNVDGYSNKSGFPLTYADQLQYNTFLANAAHSAGLSAGLKNDIDQVKDLLPYFDFAINEQCFQYNECKSLSPFISAGKAVFNVEYKLSPSNFCSKASSMKFSSIKKKLSLNNPVTFCE